MRILSTIALAVAFAIAADDSATTLEVRAPPTNQPQFLTRPVTELHSQYAVSTRWSNATMWDTVLVAIPQRPGQSDVESSSPLAAIEMRVGKGVRHPQSSDVLMWAATDSAAVWVPAPLASFTLSQRRVAGWRVLGAINLDALQTIAGTLGQNLVVTRIRVKVCGVEPSASQTAVRARCRATELRLALST